jgi:hypothetical protein
MGQRGHVPLFGIRDPSQFLSMGIDKSREAREKIS